MTISIKSIVVLMFLLFIMYICMYMNVCASLCFSRHVEVKNTPPEDSALPFCSVGSED